ncbi:MAG: F0F1 ATP synthase subunit B [Longimicrobiales bacterium]|jgi:F-type H+-transporting ATPase subunit b|nr:F0F1 ATP synthase subunit B [Longimicrobiales bacterium]|tara:strand:+ start:2771 stop:3274 length:504 start_codon:yes stop_codon:yes gene_type:complete
MFDINLGLSIWTIVVFVLLLLILRRFAWGPILRAVQDREDHVRSTLESAASEREESTELLEQYRKQMLEARREAQDLIAKAKEMGVTVRKEIEEKARQEANVIMEKARVSIEKEKEAALDELRQGSVDIALAAAGKLIAEELNQDKDRKLAVGFVNDLSAEVSKRSP